MSLHLLLNARLQYLMVSMACSIWPAKASEVGTLPDPGATMSGCPLESPADANSGQSDDPLSNVRRLLGWHVDRTLDWQPVLTSCMLLRVVQVWLAALLASCWVISRHPLWQGGLTGMASDQMHNAAIKICRHAPSADVAIKRHRTADIFFHCIILLVLLRACFRDGARCNKRCAVKKLRHKP